METTCVVNTVVTKLKPALTNYASLKDTNNAPKTWDQEARRLRKIKRSGLVGEFSAWLFHHPLQCRFLFAVTVYIAADTFLAKMEGKL